MGDDVGFGEVLDLDDGHGGRVFVVCCLLLFGVYASESNLNLNLYWVLGFGFFLFRVSGFIL